jgi:NAD(P)H-quinone oxidoreductase subunit 5
MNSADTLYQLAWLIPVLPLLGAAVVGMGLISYGDATSKLRQPSSVFIVSLTGAAMVLSFSAAVESGAGSRYLHSNV